MKNVKFTIHFHEEVFFVVVLKCCTIDFFLVCVYLAGYNACFVWWRVKSFFFSVVVCWLNQVYVWIDGNNNSTKMGIEKTYFGAATFIGSSSTQRCRRIPSHNWTPIMPNMKNTKKHSSSTLPSIGNVSSNSITRIRIPFWWN